MSVKSVVSPVRDHTGVPTAQLAAVYHSLVDCDLKSFAGRIMMDERDLKKIVITQNYPFTGIAIADKIVQGLGQQLSHLERIGELTVIPSKGKSAARRMAMDTFWARGDDPTQEELDQLADELFARRDLLCAPNAEQQERQRAESERHRLARDQRGEAAA